MVRKQSKKIGDANRGRSPSEEQKQQISESLKGRKITRTPEHQAKLNEAMKKRVVSEEMKEKIRQKLLGRKRPPEECEKISRSLMGNQRAKKKEAFVKLPDDTKAF